MERPGMFSCGPNFFKYTGQEKYLAIAEKCANHSYKNANSRNANLCCGISGNAYAMLNMYNATQQKAGSQRLIT